jgi:hypothetical protein
MNASPPGNRNPIHPTHRTQDELRADYEQRQEKFEHLKTEIMQERGVLIASKLHAHGELQDGEEIALGVEFFAENAAKRGTKPFQIDLMRSDEWHDRLSVAEKQVFEIREKERGSIESSRRETEQGPAAEQSGGQAEPEKAPLHRRPAGVAPSPNSYAELDEAHTRAAQETIDRASMRTEFGAAADEVTGRPRPEGPREPELDPSDRGPSGNGPNRLSPAAVTPEQAARFERLNGNFENDGYGSPAQGHVAAESSQDHQMADASKTLNRSERESKEIEATDNGQEMTDTRAARMERLRGNIPYDNEINRQVQHDEHHNEGPSLG